MDRLLLLGIGLMIVPGLACAFIPPIVILGAIFVGFLCCAASLIHLCVNAPKHEGRQSDEP